MYLLDTHTLLWTLFKEDSLSVNAKKVILEDNDIFVSYLKKLPQIHGDPFDRLIISQATIEKLTIVTKDAKFPAYGIMTLW